MSFLVGRTNKIWLLYRFTLTMVPIRLVLKLRSRNFYMRAASNHSITSRPSSDPGFAIFGHAPVRKRCI